MPWLPWDLCYTRSISAIASITLPLPAHQETITGTGDLAGQSPGSVADKAGNIPVVGRCRGRALRWLGVTKTRWKAWHLPVRAFFGHRRRRLTVALLGSEHRKGTGPLSEEAVTAIAFSPDGELILTAPMRPRKSLGMYERPR